MTISIQSWNTEDNEWNKQREADWSDYEHNLRRNLSLEEDHYTSYKEYFLTGCDEARSKFSENKQSRDAVIEMWLHAANNTKIFKKISEQIGDISVAQSFFKVNCLTSSKEFRGASHLNGKDLNIYKAIFPERLRRIDYPEIDEQKFKLKAHNVYLDYLARIIAFLDRDEIVPWDYCLVSIPYWRDGLINGFEEHEYLKFLVEDVLKYERELEALHPIKANFVKEIADVLNDESLPLEVKLFIKRVREGNINSTD